MDGGKCRLVDDGSRPSGTGDLVEHILCHFQVRQTGKVVVHSDPLAQGLMDRFLKCVVQMRLPAEDEREAVQGVIPVVHEHL